jgi:hypothetical protein
LRHLQQLALCYVLHAARQYYLLHCNDQPRMRYTVLYSTTTNTLYTATCAYQHHYCNYYCITQQDVNFDLWSNLKHALPHLLIYALSTAAAVKCCVELAAHYGRVTLSRCNKRLCAAVDSLPVVHACTAAQNAVVRLAARQKRKQAWTSHC